MILYTFCLSLLSGFGLYSLLYILLPKDIFFSHPQLYKLDDTACQIFIWTGISTLLLGSWIWIEGLIPLDDETRDTIIYNLLLGPSALPILIVGVGTQILWIKSIREVKWIRLLIALFMLVSYHDVIIWFTDFHRDYVSSSSSLLLTKVQYIGASLLKFLTVLGLVYMGRWGMK